MVEAIESIRTLPVLMVPQPESGYTITCPLLPELITGANDPSDIYSHVADALLAVMELYQNMNRPLPVV